MSATGAGADVNGERGFIHRLGATDEETRVIPVTFYPTEYTVESGSSYADQSMPGASPIVQYVAGQGQRLTFELLLDTYERTDVTDVREYTNGIDALLEPESKTGAPPLCRVAWGSLEFSCVLESATKRFVMFDSEGVPVRARVNATFREYERPDPPQLGESDLPEEEQNTRTVKQGDTLWMIASEEYGDPRQWRRIATANDIDDPRTLQIGRELIIPPRGD